jgi:hypothetical protein
MKRLMFIFGVIGAGLCNHAAHAAAPAECYASPVAVFAAHPNAAHASYTRRVKGSERCWFADSVNSDAKAKAKPAPHPVATVARSSAPPPAITAPAPQPHAMAVAPAEQPRTAAVAPAPRPRIPAIAPASLLVTVPFPSGTPPSIQIVNARELSRLLPVEETQADFESRFSASGYKVRK